MDIQSLKEYIFNNDYIETILKSIGCHSIKYHTSGAYYTCANKTGDNKQAITIYNNENLTCINYTRQISTKERATDLLDLVVYNNHSTFPEALKFISDCLGLDYYHNFNEDMPKSLQITRFILDMSKEINDSEEQTPIKVIPESILNDYSPYVNDLFFNDHIDYETQKEFEIGYDDHTNMITIPIRSEIGDLVGIKGRVFQKYLESWQDKYIYLEPTPRYRILYGLHKTIKFIEEAGAVYVTESEKGVMQLWSYGYMNAVATSGMRISREQINMLIRLGVKIVFCFDKDVAFDDLQDIGKKFNNVKVYAVYDNLNILNEKESPTDSPEKWECLKNNIIEIN